MRKRGNWFQQVQTYFNEKTQSWFNKLTVYVGFLGSVFTILQFVQENPVKNIILLNKLILLIKNHNSIVIWTWIILAFVIILKYRSSVISKMNVSSIDFAKVLRCTLEVLDDIDNIDVIHEQSSNKCGECPLSDELKRKMLNTLFIQYTIIFLDRINDIMETYVGYKTSTCFKMIVDSTFQDDEHNIDINNSKKSVVTLARDRGTDEKRGDNDQAKPVQIELNSDFSDIVRGFQKRKNNSYFYNANLKKYRKDLEKLTNGQYTYLNSTSNWEDFYIGTIVVPVGNSATSQEGKKCEILGFLCVDSLSRKAFTEKQKTINVKLLQGYADVFGIAAQKYKEKLYIYSGKGKK